MCETATELATSLLDSARLSPDRCRALLCEAKEGYVALSRGALPIVLPVTCAMDGGSLLVRAGPGSLDRAARQPIGPQPAVVAFGTTVASPDGTCRWELLVQGRAEAVRQPATDVPPRLPFIDSSLTTVFRVTPELLTGWEYRPAF